MIFKFFASSVQLGQMLLILTNICDRDTICYISSRDLWINRLYFDISNENRINSEQIQKIILNNFVIMHKKKKEMGKDGRRPKTVH